MELRSIGITGIVLALGASALGCGGGASESTSTTTTAASERETTSREPDDGAQITGLMGTISQEAVRNTLEPRMDSFMRCFEQRLASVRFLGGDFRMEFRIHVDGTVAWVYPAESSLGDRDVETCILASAARAHFPRPRGGEAEFAWGFSLDPPGDVRAPIAFVSSGIDTLVAAERTNVETQCGQGNYAVTAYVQPGGSVLAAGVATDSTDAAAHLDCVATAVRGWTFPDPGSYAGKVSFSL